MLFSRLSLTGLPPAPSAVLPQPPPPQHLPAPQHSLCKFSFFFLVVLHLLTLVSERYLQLLCHPIPLCRIPTLRRHHPLHTSSAPLLASSGCVDALVTTPICPWLNVSFYLLSFCFCSLLLHCPFVPHPFPHAVSVLSCCVPSLMPHPLSHAMSVLLCCVFTPTCATSTPLPLAYPSCIDVPTSVCHVGCLSTPLHCTLCSACIVPPPPPIPLPCLMCASVHVPVRLCTCYFTCIRIRL